MEQLKFVFASKIEIKDKDLVKKTRKFSHSSYLRLLSTETVDDHEGFISVNDIDDIIKNLDTRKPQV